MSLNSDSEYYFRLDVFIIDMDYPKRHIVVGFYCDLCMSSLSVWALVWVFSAYFGLCIGILLLGY